MPKVRSSRSISRAHTASAKPVNRTFAVQDNAAQRVIVGAFKDVSADEILHSVDNDGDSIHPHHATNLNKKEKRILKHELFIERLEASRAPYSKSHARRLKRKEREQLAGSGMESLKTALPSITSSKSAGEDPGDVTTTSTKATTATSTGPSDESECAPAPDTEAPSPPTRLGQIDQGKGTPLTRSQRRRALKAERFRQPLIRADPSFAANPFGTIRTHAQNTLVSHPATT